MGLALSLTADFVARLAVEFVVRLAVEFVVRLAVGVAVGLAVKFVMSCTSSTWRLASPLPTLASILTRAMNRKAMYKSNLQHLFSPIFS